jgi:hypothetical protein
VNIPQLALSFHVIRHWKLNAARSASYASPHILLPHCAFPIQKMALEHDQTSADFPTNTNKDTIVSEKKDGNGNLDAAEKGSNGKYAKYGSNNKVGGRIGPVLVHLKNYDFGSDDSGSDILGKQIELEADNAIQYRTCSWQKVSMKLFFYSLERCQVWTSEEFKQQFHLLT